MLSLLRETHNKYLWTRSNDDINLNGMSMLNGGINKMNILKGIMICNKSIQSWIAEK